MKKTILLALAAAVVAMPAAAQDYSQTATAGILNLSSGFTPDPMQVGLIAGGSIDVSQTFSNSNCVGMIANAPDVSLTWSAGNSGLPLVFTTRSSVDTTLVVNGPDGRWYCDDDSGGGLNARVIFNNPSSGKYDVWVGTYSASPDAATLLISEIR